MPKFRSTGAVPKKYTLDDGIWQWRIVEQGEAFGSTKSTEECLSKQGNEMIQIIVKVGDKDGQIVVVEYVTFSAKAEWKLNEFLKSAGIYPGEVEYFITAEMCVGLSGKCQTKNKQDGDYTNTNILKWLEAPKQDASFLTSTPPPKDSKPVADDEIPW